MSMVYVGGTYDLFHAGHCELLREAWNLAQADEAWHFAGKVVVALNTDEFIKSYKGRTPVCTYAERKTVLESVRYVDRVIPNSGNEDSKPSILSVQPDYICAGSDWTHETLKRQMELTEAWLNANGIRIHIVPRTTGVSSSSLKRRI